MLTALMLVLLLARVTACSSSDQSSQPLPVASTPPALHLLPLPYGIELYSDDASAQLASEWLNEALSYIWNYAGMAHAALGPTQWLEWESRGNDCFECGYTVGGEMPVEARFSCCLGGDTLGWEYRLIGYCPDGTICRRALRTRGTTDALGNSGELRYYAGEDSLHPVLSWRFAAAADRDSSSWRFYAGTPDPLALVGLMDWSQDAAGTRRWDWRWPEDERLLITFHPDSTAGACRSWLWNAGAGGWDLKHDFEWSGGHGSWVTYSVTGEPIAERVW